MTAEGIAKAAPDVAPQDSCGMARPACAAAGAARGGGAAGQRAGSAGARAKHQRQLKRLTLLVVF